MLAFFMGLRTKAILWLLPLLPAQNWLYWNALIAAEQKDALCPWLCIDSLCVDIKTASVSSQSLPPAAEHHTSVSLYSQGNARMAVVCMQ